MSPSSNSTAVRSLNHSKEGRGPVGHPLSYYFPPGITELVRALASRLSRILSIFCRLGRVPTLCTSQLRPDRHDAQWLGREGRREGQVPPLLLSIVACSSGGIIAFCLVPEGREGGEGAGGRPGWANCQIKVNF